MNPLIQFKTITSPLLITFTLVGFALLPRVQAVVPPPDGGYPGFNTAEGTNALFNLTTGSANTAVGWFSLFSNTDGSFNTAAGAGALLFNTANQNTAFGTAALLFNTTGQANTGVGSAALLNNTTGDGNTATGARALTSNTIGSQNTANGTGALQLNTEGDNNTANGTSALILNTTGGQNTAVGSGALFGNNSSDNTAVGFQSLFSNTTGIQNTATGAQALASNTSGQSNTATGYLALLNNQYGNFNNAVGRFALASNTTGMDNTAIGDFAGFNQTTGGGNVYIGSGVTGLAGEGGACYIRSIFGQVSAGGTQVFVNSNHKLGTTTSSKRFKENIKPMDKASEALFSLKPVSFRYKKEIDPASKSQFGLVAEDVERVHPDLVIRDKEGKPYSVRYDQVNAMLLNEFLKEHRRNEEQEAIIARLVATDTRQQKQIEALTAALQKVSNAQLELSKSAPLTVLNDQ
jgi:hypothetical protein